LHARAGRREVPSVAGDEEVSLPFQSTSNELVVIRIRRNTGHWSRVEETAATAEHVQQGVYLAGWKSESRPKQNIRVFLENLGRKIWRNQPLVDRHEQQGFIPSGGNHG